MLRALGAVELRLLVEQVGDIDRLLRELQAPVFDPLHVEEVLE